MVPVVLAKAKRIDPVIFGRKFLTKLSAVDQVLRLQFRRLSHHCMIAVVENGDERSCSPECSFQWSHCQVRLSYNPCRLSFLSYSNSILARASSVLQKNSKWYGPMNALDLENTTTCWNSEGCPSGKQSSQYTLDFGRLVEPVELRIQFQAGFIGEELKIFWLDGSSWKPLGEEDVEDDHDLQTFSLIEAKSGIQTRAIKLSFDNCTDFYSRVTIYQLQVWGYEVAVEKDVGKDSK